MVRLRPVLDPIPRRADPCPGQRRGDVQQERQVGQEAPRGHPADAPDLVGRQSARVSLVDDVGQQEAVRDDDAAGLQGGTDHLLDQLGTAGHVKQHLGAEGGRDRLPVEQEVAEPIAERGPPRVSTGDDVDPRAEPGGQGGRLRGLAPAIGAVQGEEQPPRGGSLGGLRNRHAPILAAIPPRRKLSSAQRGGRRGRRGRPARRRGGRAAGRRGGRAAGRRGGRPPGVVVVAAGPPGRPVGSPGIGSPCCE